MGQVIEVSGAALKMPKVGGNAMSMGTRSRVDDAKALAGHLGVTTKCSDETGALLRLLAATKPGGVVAEIGAGCGVGTSWLLSGCAPNTRLITVEREPARATAAGDLFADDERVTVLSGGWELIAEYAPFDLLFVDAALPKHQHPEQVLPLLAPGGMVILDDLTPLPVGIETYDPLRSFWYGLVGWSVAEVQLSPREAMLLAVRLVSEPAPADG